MLKDKFNPIKYAIAILLILNVTFCQKVTLIPAEYTSIEENALWDYFEEVNIRDGRGKQVLDRKLYIKEVQARKDNFFHTMHELDPPKKWDTADCLRRGKMIFL